MMITSDMVAAIDAASAANEDPDNDASNEVGVDDGLLTNQKLVFLPKEEETTDSATSDAERVNNNANVTTTTEATSPIPSGQNNNSSSADEREEIASQMETEVR